MLVVIPNHNEERIEETTRETNLIFPEARIVIVNDHEGLGKGWALRQGISGNFHVPLVFIDGDMDIHPKEIFKLLPHLSYFDIVVGKKQTPKGIRGWITRLSRIYIRLVFGIKVDTQTGLKLFNYKPEWVTDGWACDIEILYRAKRMGKTMVEVPIVAQVSKSKTLGDLWRTLKESVRILVS